MSLILKVILFSFLFNTVLRAQTNDTIRSGRPGKSIGPYVVGTKILQIQSGFDFAEIAGVQNSTLFNNVIRYGLSEHFEVSSVIDLQRNNFKNPITKDLDGLSDVQVGFRYNLISKPDGLLPAFGIQTRFKLNTVDSDYKADSVAPVIIFTAAHDLTKRMSLGSYLGIAYDGETSDPTYDIISNISYTLSQTIGLFIEAYSSFQDNTSTLNYDGGLSYYVTNDLMFDISAGYGKNSGVEDYFVSSGVSWRVGL